MKVFRNEIKHIMRAVTVLTVLFSMTFVLAGSANAVVISPFDNPLVLNAPLGSLNPLGVASGIVRPPIGFPAVNPFFRPPVFNPFFRPPVFNPFFRPPVFNPFFRPPIFNPFLGADLDDLGLGLGIGGLGIGGLGIGGFGIGGLGVGIGEAD